MNDYICHYGIRGQKWGVKNGQPYPSKGGDYSAIEKSLIRDFPTCCLLVG